MKHLYEYIEYDQLSKGAKKNAINNVRSNKEEGQYGGDDVSWVVDDDALFEPSDEEMQKIFGEDYFGSNGSKFMISNDRDDISFVGKQDSNYYLHCSKALQITNENLFYRWLGIPTKYVKYIYYTFNDHGNTNTRIDFELDDEEGLIEKFGPQAIETVNSYFTAAEKKFRDHIDHVLDNISSSIDSEYEDEGIVNTIENHSIQFDEEGNIEK